MSKRLRDTALWDKTWFRKLPTKYKCFVDYILSKCDHAGVWPVDFDAASFFIGEDIIPEEIPLAIIQQLEISELDADKWLIGEFIPFQYGKITEKHKMFKAIDGILCRYGIDTVSIGYKYGIDRVKEQRKDKDKEKDKEQRQEKDTVDWGKIDTPFARVMRDRKAKS